MLMGGGTDGRTEGSIKGGERMQVGHLVRPGSICLASLNQREEGMKKRRKDE